MTRTLTFDAFKTLVNNDSEFKSKITNKSDVINIDEGSMLIHRENVDKYLERYMCKDENDLEDTLWFSYGIYVKIVD